MSDWFLMHYNLKKEIISASDVSSFRIGACIMHKLKDGSIKHVHASRTLLSAEKNYSLKEKKSLGIVFTLMKFHRFIHGRRFTLQTDHRPLLTILGSKRGLPIYTANRLLQWGTILLNYDFLPSSKLCHADGSSRLIPNDSESLEDTVIASLQAEVEI